MQLYQPWFLKSDKEICVLPIFNRTWQALVWCDFGQLGCCSECVFLVVVCVYIGVRCIVVFCHFWTLSPSLLASSHFRRTSAVTFVRKGIFCISEPLSIRSWNIWLLGFADKASFLYFKRIGRVKLLSALFDQNRAELKRKSDPSAWNRVPHLEFDWKQTV